MPAFVRQPPFAVLLGLAWAAVAALQLLENWGETGLTLFDTDDAMRLVQVKAWLAGQGWFDLHQPRLQPPLGYDAHWSRLIDAGLAGLFSVLRIFAEAGFAERLMRAVWPLLWLIPTMGGMAAIAWRIAGREAALVALLLALVGVPAYQQFTPGRIDHHNVQIACTMLAVAATVWSDRMARAGIVAGLCTALAIAVGFEALPYLGLCGAAFALRFVFDSAAAQALRHYASALSIGTAAAFLVDVPQAHWMNPLCDAIAINSAAAVVIGAAGLAVAASLAPAAMSRRMALVACAGSVALTVGLLIEPRCIKGPYAMVDPAVWPIWLSEVREMQPLWRVFAVNPLTASAIVAFPAAGLVASLFLFGERAARRDFGMLVALGVFLAAVAMTIGAIRAYSYAIWFGMPLVAAVALRLFGFFRLRSVGGRAFASLMMTPLVLSSGAIGIAAATGFDDRDSFARPATRACFRTGNYAPLASLPPGLIAADVSFGPFFLALTPHSALAAPYHRLTVGITAAHDILSLPPERAEQAARNVRIDYVVVCGPRPPDGIPAADLSASLWGNLQAGRVPDWLTPVRLPDGSPFHVYRIRG